MAWTSARRWQQCGTPWDDSLYCPPCQDILAEIEACPVCGGVSDAPGDLCPPCDEIRAEIEACPGCGGVSDTPGDLCPVCVEIQEECCAEEEEESPPWV
jgi:hypothetical protein